MRTGSPRQGLFQGDPEAEYAWFSISDALPAFSISAERAARSIVNACARGDAELNLSLPTKFAVALHGLFPGLTADVLGLVNRLLPAAPDGPAQRRRGKDSASAWSPSWLTALNEQAAERNNEISPEERQAPQGAGTSSAPIP